MHREFVLELLRRYREVWPAESAVTDRIEEFVHRHEDCLLRTCVPGHITASTWILSPDRRQCLLTHHKKLDKWLQLGGHVDGESEVHRAALREAQEESGMERFELIASAADGALVPLDLDVHEIPARKNEPAHDHHDFRFLLVAAAGQELVISDESNDLAWVDVERLTEFTQEESVLRLQRKAVRL